MTDPTPTLAERLQDVPTVNLSARLGVAQLTLAGGYAVTPQQRAKVLEEIEAVRAELGRRGNGREI
jgi:hypothetical protein